MSKLTPPADDPAPAGAAVGRRRAADADAVPVWRRALLTRRAASRYLSMSPAKLDRLNAAGLCPRPLKIGGCVMYRRAELTAWIAAGCPDRRTWDALRATPKK